MTFLGRLLITLSIAFIIAAIWTLSLQAAATAVIVFITGAAILGRKDA